MNANLQEHARAELIKGLSQLPEGWTNKFRRMYGNPSDSV